MNVNFTPEQGKACLEIENAELRKENQKLKKEVAKLHIIQEEYGNHIENTHIIDDYQKTYFMSNKYLIELKNGKFVYIDEIEKENQRLNNDIKVLLKENEAKEKVIIKQDNVLNELEKWLNTIIKLTANIDEKKTCENVLKKLNKLKESDK